MKSCYNGGIRRSRLLILVLAVLLFSCPGLSATAYASDSDFIRVGIDSFDAGSVHYTVESSVAYGDALAIAAVYRGARLVEVKMKPLTIESGTYSDSQSFTQAFTEVKVMLVDAASFAPLCVCGKKCSVVFADFDGSVISEQSVLSGGAASRPADPIRDGYVFLGWGDGYKAVYDDAVITARYVPENAENIFLVTSASGGVGDEVVVTVSLGGTVSLCGFDMRLLYDGNELEFVSADSELSMDIVANHVPGSNSMLFNFSSRVNRTVGGDIVKVTFRTKSGISDCSVLELKPVEVIRSSEEAAGDLIPVEFAITEGVITAK